MLPSFSKPGVMTVTLSRGSLFPRVQPKVLNQFVGISDDNTIRVAVIGPPLETIPLEFKQLTVTDKALIEAFFSAINYGASEFVYMDEMGVGHAVRYLEPTLALPEVSEDNVEFTLMLTKVG